MRLNNILKKLVVEQSRFNLLRDTLTTKQKNKEGKIMEPKLTFDQFNRIVEADPTTRLNGVNLDTATPDEMEKVKAGKYVNWLIKQFLTLKGEGEPGDRGYNESLKRNKELFFEDLYKVKDDLKKFDRFKNRIPSEFTDINKLTIDTLYDITKDFDLNLATTTKAERKKMSVHPGAKLAFEGNRWTVLKIENKGELGKEAACFYGGIQDQVQTRWCTSAPGLSYFNNYINQGPLYVIYNPNDPVVDSQSGLPIERYQFHFETNQFMDRHNHQINVVKEFNGPMGELKEFFEPMFIKLMTKSDIGGGNRLVIDNLTSGNAGVYVGIYGLDKLFDTLPTDISAIEISDSSGDVAFDVPETINRFTNLTTLILDNCIRSLPATICELNNLTFLTLRNNKNLTTIPGCIADLDSMFILNLRGSNVKLPQEIRDRVKDAGDGLYDFL